MCGMRVMICLFVLKLWSFLSLARCTPYIGWRKIPLTFKTCLWWPEKRTIQEKSGENVILRTECWELNDFSYYWTIPWTLQSEVMLLLDSKDLSNCLRFDTDRRSLIKLREKSQEQNATLCNYSVSSGEL